MPVFWATPALNDTVPQIEAIANIASPGQGPDRAILQLLGCTCATCQGIAPLLQ